MSVFVASVVDAFLLRHGFLHPPRPKACQERGHADGPVAKKRKDVRSSQISPDNSAVVRSSSGAAAVPTARHTETHATQLMADPTVCSSLSVKLDSEADIA